MPPAPRPRQAHPQTDRCRFADRQGNRCRRVATVGDGFCRQHAIALELELDSGGAGVTLLGAIDRLFTQQRHPLGSMFNGVLGGLLSSSVPKLTPRQQKTLEDAKVAARQIAHEALQNRLRQQQAQRAQAQRANSPPPPPPPPPAPRIDPLQAAREVLGFEPGEKLTVERVQDRKRALARVFHPDMAGGSKAQMQKVLAAADALLAKIS